MCLRGLGRCRTTDERTDGAGGEEVAKRGAFRSEPVSRACRETPCLPPSKVESLLSSLETRPHGAASQPASV